MARTVDSHIRTKLTARLWARRGEIEEAVLTRVRAISDPSGPEDPAYAAGLRSAVGVALEYGLVGVNCDAASPPPVPIQLLAQARLAARGGVGLDTVLRRYFAGYSLLGDFIVGEANAAGIVGDALKTLLRTQAVLLDAVLVAVSEEFGREQVDRATNFGRRHVEQVERLLSGAPVDTATISYDFGFTHLGMVASGPRAAEALRERAAALDCSLLLVRRDEATALAWLGARRGIDAAHTGLLNPVGLPPSVVVAIGEPAEGLAGWRLTHRQASAALLVAKRSGARTARYAEVALLAAALQDDVLATSLHRLYLAPLGELRGAGATARETLRAYLKADRNLSSAAAALAVHRETVTNRLRAIEARIGRPPDACIAELEVALQLEELASEDLIRRTGDF